ncbi:hypothetical protein QQG55_23240 [Brugia pahangi]
MITKLLMENLRTLCILGTLRKYVFELRTVKLTKASIRRRYGKSTFRVVTGQQSARELSRSVLLHFGSISCEAVASEFKTLKLGEFQLKVSSTCCSEITAKQRETKR